MRGAATTNNNNRGGAVAPQRGGRVGGPLGNAMANASVRGRGNAPNHMMARGGAGLRTGPAIPANQFAHSFNVMKDLINEYDELSLTSLDDLKQKYEPQNLGVKLMHAVATGNYVEFSKFVSILETEKEMMQKAFLQKPKDEVDSEDDDEYYYQEDIPEEYRNYSKTPITEVTTLKEYLLEMTKVCDKPGEKLLHLAVIAVNKRKDLNYLSRLLAIGYPIYQENAFGQFATDKLLDIEDDNLFCKTYLLFKKRGFDPITENSRQTHNSFI